MTLQEKYARVLLESCLKVEENQPLFISYNIERSDFVRIVTKIALGMGVKDIYFDGSDPYIKHEALLNLEVDELKGLTFWNKKMWDVYAEKDAAFLMLASETPGLMKDVDPEKLSAMTKYAQETRRGFDARRDKSELAWCIAAVPTTAWAEELFKESANPVEDLWNSIFDICSIKEDDPVAIWNEKISKLKIRGKKLTDYQFKTLKYKSSNGTDFSIDLPKGHIWASGNEKLANGKEVLVNFPTEEVFTSPDCQSANGIVYSSKPLSYQDVLIDNFNIKFENGKVVEVHAEQGEETLKQMVNVCENADRLGEVALVPFDSPISRRKSNCTALSGSENRKFRRRRKWKTEKHRLRRRSGRSRISSTKRSPWITRSRQAWKSSLTPLTARPGRSGCSIRAATASIRCLTRGRSTSAALPSKTGRASPALSYKAANPSLHPSTPRTVGLPPAWMKNPAS